MSFTLDTYALTTLADVKEHLNVKPLDVSQDNILTRMINASSEMIETFLDRKILQRTYTEFYDGRGNDRMLLRQWPVVKPTQLWNDPSGLFTSPSDQYPVAEYETEGEPAVGVILLSGQKFSKGNRNVKVVYQGGYVTTPYVIAEACILCVEFSFDMRSDRRIGVQTKGKNQESTTFLGDLPEFVKNMLAPYQRLDGALAYQGVQNS